MTSTKQTRRSSHRRAAKNRGTNKNQANRLAKTNIRVTVVGIIVAALIALAVAYVRIDPDLRYVPSLPENAVKTLEQKFDENGNWVILCQTSFKFTNFSWRPGYIERVQIVPLSIKTTFDAKVTQISSEPIHKNEIKTVTIMYVLTIPTNGLNNLGTTRDLPLDLTFDAFDNTGRRVDHESGGMFARIHFTANLRLTISPPIFK